MKRNYPPDERSADLQKEEHEIIEQRLNELYFSPGQVRSVSTANKATYLDNVHHVRLEPGTKHLEGFSQYSKDLGYHYILPYQALYLLESRQILIFYNELPLSIAEAYKILLNGISDFQNYVVFSHLNSNGYFCLPHQNTDYKSDLKASICEARLAYDERTKELSSEEVTRPILSENDFIDKTYEEVMDLLRSHGPREPAVMKCQLDESWISFDAYKRESYTKNKPKASKKGQPDYHVIVQDKNTTTFPSGRIEESCSQVHDCNKYLFAIIDADSSLSFVQCDALTDSDLDINALS